MTERLANLGYMALIKQTAPNTVLTPNIFAPLYEESMETLGNFQDLQQTAGSKYARQQTIVGIRSHKGDFTCMAEPNTAAHLFNGLLTQGTSTNSGGVYTYPFTGSADSATYVMDISLGNVVKRFWGVKFSKISPEFNDNEMRFKVAASAIGSFDAREISSITGSGPYTVTLKDPDGVYDGNPTVGLVVGDLISFYDVSLGTYITATVATIPTGLTFTTATNPTLIASGDTVHLRPATPSYNNLSPFLWSKARFQFGATASAALSAAHTPVEQGSTWEVMHSLNDEDGEKRSGSHDPAGLVRTTFDTSLKIKKIMDDPIDIINFKGMTKTACVVKMFAGPINQYELRLTYNHLKTDKPIGFNKVGELITAEIDYHPVVDSSDAQAFDAKVLCALTTV